MKTHIFGTFGPACATEEILGKMIEAGMTGMRLNLSHSTLAESNVYIRNYQQAAEAAGVVPQILIDMQGPELRIGKLEDEVFLKEGETIPLEAMVPDVVRQQAEAGDMILLDDGKQMVQIQEATVDKLVAKVIRGGKLQSHKSIKIVGKDVKLPPLTQHDMENIKVAKDYGVTALMQPFVTTGEDLRKIRAVLKAYGAEGVSIFAKIENRIGIEHMEDILTEADVIVIARGDLGNDMPLWELPAVQKKIENACKEANKPYIVVTQMLASMETNPVPTRAEVSDIYHAVYHGAWGVMLTGETAIGKYPIEAIRYMANTAEVAEMKN